MLNDLVKTKLKLLRMPSALLELEDILRETQKNSKGYLDFLNSILECELYGREVRRIQRRIKKAEFPVTKTLSDLIVIDEIGYFPYEKGSSELFFQYIAERYERGSMIITTNLPFSQWNEIFYTERLTTAILDRLIHH